MSVFTVLNPATEEPVTTVTQASLEATDEAIARAAEAWPAWRAVAPGDRARMLRAFAEAVDSCTEELAGLEVAGSGHPIGAARAMASSACSEEACATVVTGFSVAGLSTVNSVIA